MAKRRSLRREPRVQTIEDLPVWLAAKLYAQREGWRLGIARTCLHNPKPGRAAVHMCSWRPELVTCPLCTHLLHVTVKDPRGSQCDCCDRAVDTIGGKMVVAEITYWFTVCEACQQWKMTRA